MAESERVEQATMEGDVQDRLSQEETIVSLFRSTSSVPSECETTARDDILNIVDAYAKHSDAECVSTPLLHDSAIQGRFLHSEIPESPVPLNQYLKEIVPTFVKDSVNVGCSRQIGHMTGTLPHYMPPLAELVTSMNQNVVKTETANTVTRLEKQVISCIHRLIYKMPSNFYDNMIQDTEVTAGVFTSGGTVANITGLWIARNGSMGPDPAGNFEGVEDCGMLQAAAHYGYTDAVIIGSAMMHYSLKKAADVLGIGVKGLVTCGYDENYRVRVEEVEQKLQECQQKKVCVIAVVGIAGATETGSVDDLQALASLAKKYKTHFHVDAAWGGPCLFSSSLSQSMAGIEKADTVTIDGHKQLFMPMGCGMLMIRQPDKCNLISKTASYIIRQGSADLGRFTLEGSRPGNAIYMHANLTCIGARGYASLMDRSARICRYMASSLRASGAFDVLFEPMMNILLYRYVPAGLRGCLLAGGGYNADAKALTEQDWQEIDDANVKLQERQKLEGRTFVSRTSVFHKPYGRRIVALRVVIGNPITEEVDIDEVIADQLHIVEGRDKPQVNTELRSPAHQEQYWRKYWDRMPEAARLFFMDDVSRFRASLVAPSKPSQLED